MFNSRIDEILGQQSEPIHTATPLFSAHASSTDEPLRKNRHHEDEAVGGAH